MTATPELAVLIGTVNHMSNVYYVWREPGQPHNAEPFYYGMMAGRDDLVPLCSHSSLAALFRAYGMHRVQLKEIAA